MPSVRARLLIACLLGLCAGAMCWDLMMHLHLGASDFTWAIQAAQDLLARRNPYATQWQLYPLPAALFGLPFVGMRPEIAAGIFYGSSTALLAFGITRDGYQRLLIFFAYPYWAGMLGVQWLPLIMACAFFSWLSPALVAKPQIGLPVALTHGGRKVAIGCLLVVLLSFIIMPNWFRLWWGQLGGYARFIPLLVLPGPLLALALLRYRDRDAWVLFLAACMPQRWFYDPFLLWLIPKSRREIVYTAGLSWIAGVWRWYYRPHTFTEVGRWTVLWLYLPMLVVLLARSRRGNRPEARSTGENES